MHLSDDGNLTPEEIDDDRPGGRISLVVTTLA